MRGAQNCFANAEEASIHKTRLRSRRSNLRKSSKISFRAEQFGLASRRRERVFAARSNNGPWLMPARPLG